MIYLHYLDAHVHRGEGRDSVNLGIIYEKDSDTPHGGPPLHHPRVTLQHKRRWEEESILKIFWAAPPLVASLSCPSITNRTKSRFAPDLYSDTFHISGSSPYQRFAATWSRPQS
ncbi:uncharacterized protein ARMOST_01173 [Armillaria ostoyae]|uniref:Uncharacterized protein n=1 Tax=Armillaria ostoyae TaxID=47428 RepID=A0A284QN67_ARMOS|nr:uncharacterized protein ARMOST_01173 [Armillaria ostoyae]